MQSVSKEPFEEQTIQQKGGVTQGGGARFSLGYYLLTPVSKHCEFARGFACSDFSPVENNKDNTRASREKMYMSE